ncbi:MAG TPA: ATP-grasp fold amidoligase family protein [Magnetospirillaceae bacterium]|nr:ATP-grasp fold amidoligase family protein [Magnetospirillaceae bacterium]
MHASPMMDRVIRHVSLRTPNLFATNVALLGLHYLLRNRALPNALSSDKAGLMDYIFWRSIGPWSAFEKGCVDKDLSKAIVRRLCPEIGIAEPLDVFPIAGMSFADFRRRLLAFSGQFAVAKPTHGSGAVLFLETEPSETALRKFYRECQASYFPLFREGQYHGLEKKVLVERSLGNPATGRKAPDDFKFFCSRGHAFLCQINVDRYGDHRLVNMSVPDFVDSGVEYGTRRPDQPVLRPPRWHDFVNYAEKLSEPFDFVRVDLYDGHDGIYFGEFTFTPGAGLTNFSDRQFERWLLLQLRKGLPPVSPPLEEQADEQEFPMGSKPGGAGFP